MSSMFQQPPRPAVTIAGRTAATTFAPPQDDDIALGWECANPALQIERWEPQEAGPTVRLTAPPRY